MTSCTIDYLTKDLPSSSYVLVYGCAVYFMPLFTLIYNYSFIVRSVAEHEEALREQARKMNVSSLRANAVQQKQSAENRLAKVISCCCKIQSCIVNTVDEKSRLSCDHQSETLVKLLSLLL